MAALLLGTPTEAEERTYSAGGEAVGYYAGWAAYQGFTPDQIPAEHLTQINYAFAQIDPDTLTIALENPAHDQKNLAALRKLFADFYGKQPFIQVQTSEELPKMLGSNNLAGKDSLKIYIAGNEERFTVSAQFDNLGKGASGAAIENMNIRKTGREYAQVYKDAMNGR